MTNFILILVCFFLGILFRHFKAFPPHSPQVLNRFVISISLPAITLSQIHRLEWGGSLLLPASMSWILFVMGAGFFYLLRHHLKTSQKTLGALILTGSLGNTSFLGFPLLEALFGVGALSVGILVDQLGTFLVAGTLGVATAASFSGGSVSAKMIFRKVVTFPPFIALLAAFALRWVPFHSDVYTLLDRLGGTLVPLSLLSVGMQLQFHPEKLKAHLRSLFWGLSFKLVLAPLFLMVLYTGLFQQRGEAVVITLVESAMAPMITAGILAAEYDLDTDLANLMIGIGIPLSLLTIPAWAWALEWIGLS